METNSANCLATASADVLENKSTIVSKILGKIWKKNKKLQ
jgi:hypothetical protein